jgi:hypothetical protein
MKLLVQYPHYQMMSAGSCFVYRFNAILGSKYFSSSSEVRGSYCLDAVVQHSQLSASMINFTR